MLEKFPKITVFFISFLLVVNVVLAEDVNVLFKTANDYFKEGKYLKAIEGFSKIIEMAHPGNERESAFLRIAESYEELEDYEKAITFYKQFIGEYPESFRVDNMRLKICHLYFKSGDYEKAISESRKYIDFYIKQEDKVRRRKTLNFYEVIANSYKMQNKWDEAEIIYKEASDKFPETDALRVLAYFYTQRGKLREALATYEELFKQFPQMAERYESTIERIKKEISEWGMIKGKVQLNDESSDDLSEIVVKAEGLSFGNYSPRGKAVFTTKTDIDGSYVLKDVPPGMYRIRAQTIGYVMQKSPEVTIHKKMKKQVCNLVLFKEVRMRGVKEQFAIAEEWKGKARSSIKPEDCEKAILAYQKVVDIYPDSEEAALSQRNIGFCYEMQRKWDKALESYQKVVDNYPNYKNIHKVMENIGDLHALLGNSKKALSAYEKALKLYPEYMGKEIIEKKIKDVKKLRKEPNR